MAGHAILKAREAIDRAEKVLYLRSIGPLKRRNIRSKHSSLMVKEIKKLKHPINNQQSTRRRRNHSNFTVAVVTSTSCYENMLKCDIAVKRESVMKEEILDDSAPD